MKAVSGTLSCHLCTISPIVARFFVIRSMTCSDRLAIPTPLCSIALVFGSRPQYQLLGSVVHYHVLVCTQGRPSVCRVPLS